MVEHRYRVTVDWSGPGTTDYTSYRRDHAAAAPEKPPIALTSGTAPASDPGRYNPEELLIASLASCHLLWYLHLCADAGIVVTDYRDDADGTLALERGGAGRMVGATLRPRVVLARGDPVRARELHHRAHELCYIARSVNFPVEVAPTVVPAPAP